MYLDESGISLSCMDESGIRISCMDDLKRCMNGTDATDNKSKQIA